MWHCSHLLLSAVLRPVLRRHCCWALGADSFDVKRAFIHSASNTFARHSAANPSHNRRQCNDWRPYIAPAGSAACSTDDGCYMTYRSWAISRERPSHAIHRVPAAAFIRPSRCSGVTRFPAPGAEATAHSASVRYANYVCVCHKLLFY